MLRRFLVALLALLTLPALAQPITGNPRQHAFFYRFDVPNGDATCVITQATETVWATYMYYYLPDLDANDVLSVEFDGQVAINTTYDVEVASQIVLGYSWQSNTNQLDTHYDSNNNYIGNYEIAHPIGTDVAVQPVHYAPIVRKVSFQVPNNMTGAVLQVRIRCRSTAATGNDTGILEQSWQSHLSVSVFR